MRSKTLVTGLVVLLVGSAIMAPFLLGYLRYRRIPMVNASSQTSELADFEFIPPMYYRKTYISDNNGLVLGCAVVVSDKSGKTLRIIGKSYEIMVFGQVRYRILHGVTDGESVQFQPW